MVATGEDVGRRWSRGGFQGRHCLELLRWLRLARGQRGQLLLQLRSSPPLCVVEFGQQFLFIHRQLPFGPERELVLTGRSFLGRSVDGVEHGSRELQPFEPEGLFAGRLFEFSELLSQGARLRQPAGHLLLVDAEFPGRPDRHRPGQHDPGEVGLQPVEVGLGNRVELVVMTLGTAYRQPEEHVADVGRQVVESVLAGKQDV